MPCQSAICIVSRKPCVFRSSDMLVFPMGLSCHRFSLRALGQKRGALTPIMSWALSSPYRSGTCVVKLVSDFASHSKILSQASKSLLSAWCLLPASMWSWCSFRSFSQKSWCRMPRRWCRMPRLSDARSTISSTKCALPDQKPQWKMKRKSVEAAKTGLEQHPMACLIDTLSILGMGWGTSRLKSEKYSFNRITSEEIHRSTRELFYKPTPVQMEITRFAVLAYWAALLMYWALFFSLLCFCLLVREQRWYLYN